MSQQHYIPQFYLKGFTDPDCPQEQEPYLWVYERGKKTPRRRAPKNIAKKAHYYSTKTDKGPDAAPEKVIAQAESIAAPLLKKLVGGRDNLTDQERVDLAMIIALMYVRVPRFRGIIEDFHSQFFQMRLRTLALNPDVLRKNIQRFERETGEKIDMPLEELYEFIKDESRYEVSVSPNLSLFHLFGHSVRIAPIIADMKWLTLRTPCGEHFISSDSPASLLDPIQRHPFYGTGFLTPDVELTFPLTRDACLFATWKGDEGDKEAHRVVVQEINRRTAGFALKYAFSSRRSLEVEELLKYQIVANIEIH